MTATATAVAVIGVLGGCGGGAIPRPTANATAAVQPLVCPSAAATTVAWPSSLPAGLPKPPTATIVSTTVTGSVSVTKFETPTALQPTLLTLLDGLRAGGFVIGRGDEEIAEADVPFAREGHNSAVRLSAVQPCRTLWLVATVAGASTAPLLPSHPAGSPLPFGSVSPTP